MLILVLCVTHYHLLEIYLYKKISSYGNYNHRKPKKHQCFYSFINVFKVLFPVREFYRPIIDLDFQQRKTFCGRTWKTDRKSTRLNSSHVKISYAVFCLKKK